MLNGMTGLHDRASTRLATGFARTLRLPCGSNHGCHLAHRCLAILLLACVGLPGAGCRDEVPEDPFNRNLGSETRPLMPAPLPNLDAAILNGRATLAPVQEPKESGGTPDDDRASIAALIEGFREAFAQGDYDTMIPMLVERQRDAARQTVPASKALREAVDKLAGTMESLDPKPAFYAQLAPMIRLLTDPPLDVANLKVVSDTEATLAIPPTSTVFRFEKVRDEWFIAMPGADDAEASTRRLTAATSLINSLTAILEDASLAPADRNARIMSLIAGAATGGAPPGADGEDDPSE